MPLSGERKDWRIHSLESKDQGGVSLGEEGRERGRFPFAEERESRWKKTSVHLSLIGREREGRSPQYYEEEEEKDLKKKGRKRHDFLYI